MFLVLVAAALTVSACHPPPPTLGPAGITAFQNLQIQKSLDTIRDIAVDANATTPPLLNTVATRKVVTWHQSAIVILHARGQGWATAIVTTLDELLRDLPPPARDTIAPYAALAKAILAGVQS